MITCMTCKTGMICFDCSMKVLHKGLGRTFFNGHGELAYVKLILRFSSFKLFIFPPQDYATIQSNRIGEVLIDYNTIVEVPIDPEFFGSTQRVQQFDAHVRNCYFPEEGQKLLNQLRIEETV